MRPIDIIIPTLDVALAERVGMKAQKWAFVTDVNIIVSHDPEKQGFTRTVNRGLAQTRSDSDICLLNDDVYKYQPGWLRTLQDSLYLNRKYGIVGPTGKCRSRPGRGRQGEYGLQVVDHLSFWCVLIKRDLYEQAGYLDEKYRHYESDNQYCWKAMKLGWDNIWVKSVYLWHTHHGSGLQK